MSLFSWAVCVVCALPLAGIAVLLVAFIVASIRWYGSGAHKRKLHSCLYEGRVRHARFHPTKHSFNYPIFFVNVDLDELPLLQSLWPLFGYNCTSVASLPHVMRPLPSPTSVSSTRIFSTGGLS